MSFWIIQKSALFSAMSEDISAVQLWISAVSEKTSAVSALIYSSENFRFQRCSELNQRCSEIFRQWTALKQTWKYCESELISAECLWDVNPGSIQPSLRNEVSKKFYFSIFIQAKNITHTWIFGLTVTAQVTKQIWCNFSKTFFRL